MNRLFGITALMLLSIMLSSCASTVGSKAIGQGGSEIVDIDIIESRAQLMVREFIDTDRRENPFYRYYSYLVITENSPDNYAKRLSASEAFMCEFSDVSKALAMGLTAENLAVFYAPINPSVDVSDLKKSRSGEDLLNVYNYDHSRVIANSIKLLKPNSKLSIAIISYPLPLDYPGVGIDNLSIDALNIIELSDIPSAQIRKTIEKFRRSVTGSYEVREVAVATKMDPATGAVLEFENMIVPTMEYITNKGWAEKMRLVFASMGAFTESFISISQASTSLCE